MNILQEALIALLSGLTTQNEDGSINWERNGKKLKLHPLNIEKETYMLEYVDIDANDWKSVSKAWYKGDKFHREDGPSIIGASGEKHWFLNDKHHRVDGPAVEYSNGDKEWFLNGKNHREDGPAIIWSGGGVDWFLNGVLYATKEEWIKEMARKNK